MSATKLLIVDDNHENLQIIWAQVQQSFPDFEVFVANNGIYALKIAKQKLPDLIVSDWQMPEFSGIDLILKLKEDPLTNHIPVILFTGIMTSPENLSTALQSGAYDYIRKPLEPIEFEARIKSCLRYINTLNKAQEGEKHYKLLADNSHDVIWKLDAKTLKFTYISPSVEKLTGYSVDETIGKGIEDAVKENVLKTIKDALFARIDAYNKGDTSAQSNLRELQQKCKDGSYIWTEIASTLVPGADGKVREIIGVSRDISKRKIAEGLLKTERDQFLSLLNDIGEVIYVSDIQSYELLFANDKLKEISSENVVGKKCYSVLQGKNTPCEFCTNNRIFGTENKVYRWEYFNPKINRYFYIIDKAIKWIDGRDARFELAIDITNLKKAEQEIRKLSMAVTQSPASIVITDTQGRIEYVNPKFTKVTGYKQKQILGKHTSILKTGHTSSKAYKKLWETIKSGKTWHGEFLNRKKNGDNFWEAVVIAPIRNDKGEICNFIAVKEDITQKKDNELALIKSEQMLMESNAAKDKFFSIIAHDLKNPFNTIINLSELLYTRYAQYDTDALREFSKSILDTANRTHMLLENLLVWARAQTGKISYEPEDITLSQVVKENLLLIQETAISKGIAISSRIENNIIVYADNDMLNTVLRNFLSNAIKFTEKSGSIYVNANVEEDFVSIEVKDTGIGIDRKDINKLFRIDSNFSTEGTGKERGTGLGLVLCNEFVERHGGKITVESEKGTGSVFKFTIPKGKTNLNTNRLQSKNDLLKKLIKTNGAKEGLKQDIVPKLKRLQEAFSSENVVLLANEVRIFSHTFDIPEFNELYNEMIKHLESLDIERINICIDDLKVILSKLGVYH